MTQNFFVSFILFMQILVLMPKSAFSKEAAELSNFYNSVNKTNNLTFLSFNKALKLSPRLSAFLVHKTIREQVKSIYFLTAQQAFPHLPANKYPNPTYNSYQRTNSFENSMFIYVSQWIHFLVTTVKQSHCIITLSIEAYPNLTSSLLYDSKMDQVNGFYKIISINCLNSKREFLVTTTNTKNIAVIDNDKTEIVISNKWGKSFDDFVGKFNSKGNVLYNPSWLKKLN